MNAAQMMVDEGTLPLPHGISHALYVEGMREVSQYVINHDRFAVRWDSIVDGKQEYICIWVPLSPRNSTHTWAENMRPTIKQRFLNGESLPFIEGVAAYFEESRSVEKSTG